MSTLTSIFSVYGVLEKVAIIAPGVGAWMVLLRQQRLVLNHRRSQQVSLLTDPPAEQEVKVTPCIDPVVNPMDLTTAPSTTSVNKVNKLATLFYLSTGLLISLLSHPSPARYTVNRLLNQDPWPGSYPLALGRYAAILATIWDTFTFQLQYFLLLSVCGKFSNQGARNIPLVHMLVEEKQRKVPREVWGWVVAFRGGLLMRVPELAARAMGAEGDEKDAWSMMAAFESFAVVLFGAIMVVLYFVAKHERRGAMVN